MATTIISIHGGYSTRIVCDHDHQFTCEQTYYDGRHVYVCCRDCSQVLSQRLVRPQRKNARTAFCAAFRLRVCAMLARLFGPVMEPLMTVSPPASPITQMLSYPDHIAEEVRLNELCKEEFRSVAKSLDKAYADEKFEADWAEFIELKRRKRMQ